MNLPFNKLSPEINFILLHCCNTNLTNLFMLHPVFKQIKPNWNVVLNNSLIHGVAPLIYYHLKKSNVFENYPKSFVGELHKAFLKNTANNMKLYSDFSKIAGSFNEAHIPVIALKGIYLADAIYQNIGLRPMSDIDILVKKEDVSNAFRILSDMEYEIRKDLYSSNFHQNHIDEYHHHKPLLIHAKTKTAVELHWDILPQNSNYRININRFWDNSLEIQLNDFSVFTFSIENHIQHICLHIDENVQSGGIRLGWFCDLRQILLKYSNCINWRNLIQDSMEYGIELPVYKNLFIVNKYFNTKLPDILLQKIRSQNLLFYEKRFLRLVKQGRLNIYDGNNYIDSTRNIKGFNNKVWFIVRDIFPTRGFMKKRYALKKSVLLVLYYPYRFLRAVYRFIVFLFRKITR